MSAPTNIEAFFADHQNPSAVVILNRGTQYEQDVTDDVTQFNTNNSIESLTGSFMLVLNNKDDHLVDRFNFCSIKKMSSIEIFVKPPKDFTNAASVASTASSMMIPQNISTLDQLINQVYGTQANSGMSSSDYAALRNNIIQLNSNTSTPVPAYQINIQGLYTANITFTANSKQIIFNFGHGKTITIIPQIQAGMSPSNLIQNDGTFLTFPSNDLAIVTNQSGKTINASGGSLPPTITPYSTDTFITVPNQINQNGIFTDANKACPIKLPIPSGSFQRIFFGVVTSVTSNTQPGGDLSVTVAGKGIGYWLEASVINLFPGGFEQTLTGLDLSAYANRFANSKALDIFKELISISTGEFPATTNLNLSNIGTTQQYLALIGESASNGSSPKQAYRNLYGGALQATDSNGNVISSQYVTFQNDGVNQNDIAGQLTLAQQKLTNVYLGFKPDLTNAYVASAAGPTKATCNQDSVWFNASSEIFKLTQENTATNLKIQTLQNELNSLQQNNATQATLDKTSQAISTNQNKIDANNTKIATDQTTVQNSGQGGSYIRGLNITIANLQQKLNAVTSVQGRNQFLNNNGIIEHWKQIFSTIILEVMDNDSFLQNIYPFSWGQRDPEPSLDGDYISKAALGQQIAEYIQYEFYFDSNGHFVLKPPFYNITVDAMGDLYIINDTDVVSCNFNDTVDGIITRIGVTGDYRESPGVEQLLMYNIFQDMNLIRQYGFHQKDISNLFYLTNPNDARDFGQSFLARNNMKMFAGSITINGRPALRIGSPIYFKPRDTVFYIREISHEFTVGTGYQTTLTVMGGRRILVGYLTNTNISNIVETVSNGNTVLSFVPGQQTTSIQNYILANGLNQESFYVDNQLIGNQPSTIQTNANTLNAQGLSTSTVGLNQVLRNKYIIVDHPNQQLIGLIIDLNSSVISNIDTANYNYFANFSVGSIPSAQNLGQLVPSPTAQQQIATTIQDAFVNYMQSLNITTPTGFTQDIRDSFIKSFLSAINIVINGPNSIPAISAINNQTLLNLAQIVANNYGIQSTTQTATVNQQNELGILSSIFNNVINYINNNGQYKQLTDAQGRELFAYQNYGLGYDVSNTIAQINNSITTAQSAANAATQQNLTQNAANKSSQLAGTTNPSSSDFNTIINNAFGPQYLAGSNTGSTPSVSQPSPTLG